jgi:hypothetical protein
MQAPDRNRNGGGGGGYAAAAAAQKAAQKKAFEGMIAALLGQGKAIDAGYDTRKGTLTKLSAASQKKLDKILKGMKAEYKGTGKNVAGVYKSGDALQAQLAAQFAQAADARAAGQANTLSAFGVSPLGVDHQYNAQDLVNAQRAALRANGTADAAVWAGMPGVAGSLMGDVKTNNSQQQQALLAAIAAAKQKSDADQAKAKADIVAQAAAAGITL